jgi:hypothetical protein
MASLFICGEGFRSQDARELAAQIARARMLHKIWSEIEHFWIAEKFSESAADCSCSADLHATENTEDTEHDGLQPRPTDQNRRGTRRFG